MHEDSNCAIIASVQKVHGLFFATDDPVRHIAWGPLSEAVKTCAECEVSKQCLEFSSISPASWKNGVYGGMLGSQRFFMPHSRTEPNLERALEDQEFILERLRAGKTPQATAQELKEIRRRERRTDDDD